LSIENLAVRSATPATHFKSQISNSRFHPGAPGQVPVSHPQFPPEPIFSILPAPTAARQKLGYLAVLVKNNVVGTMPDGYAG
jgi:hypothetical protein